MMLLALAGAAGIYTAPVPVHEDTWISSYLDFPVRGVRPEVLTVVSVEITVNPYGGMSDCRARAAHGNPNMAAYTCEILKNRTVFKPARDPSGKRMYGVYRQNISWWNMRDSPPPKHESPTEYRLKIDALPPETKEPHLTAIQFAVDTAGNGTACSPAEGTFNPGLAPIACEKLAASIKVPPARDRRGRPVPSVQIARVLFVPDEARK